MTNQLLLYANRALDHYRWCWFDAELNPLLESAGSGGLDELSAMLGEGHHSLGLLVPGSQVVIREMEYAEAEKKHLRRLLPFQLEESVIGDIERFHFALGEPREGRVALAYMERHWLENLFAQLAERNIEVNQARPLPLALPLAIEDLPPEEYRNWTLQLEGDDLLVRYSAELGYSVHRDQGQISLQLLLNAQQRVDQRPHPTLRAETDADLMALESLLPEELRERVREQALVEFWQLDLSSPAIDLCQGEFSQRLPVERWWRDWQGIIAAAAAVLLVYIGSVVMEVRHLEAENLESRREIERVFREAAGPGAMADPEQQLRQALRELDPGASGRAVVPFLADLFPAMEATSEAQLNAISYSARNHELNLNVRADTFNAIERLRSEINQRGLEAELLSASAQGDSHSARLKVSAGAP